MVTSIEVLTDSQEIVELRPKARALFFSLVARCLALGGVQKQDPIAASPSPVSVDSVYMKNVRQFTGTCFSFSVQILLRVAVDATKILSKTFERTLKSEDNTSFTEHEAFAYELLVLLYKSRHHKLRIASRFTSTAVSKAITEPSMSSWS